MNEWFLIASADKNWGIGLKNHLLARIPEDMKYVSDKTKGKVIVMGRKTLESFPGGRPLPDRVNVVLTNNNRYIADRVIVVHSIKELTDALRDYKGEIYVFGGESIYLQLLPLCRKAYITRFKEEFEADAHLPCFDSLGGWRLVYKGEWQTSRTGLLYQFTEYENTKPAKDNNMGG